ncbi:MAG: F0F1 ATP synthase subunit delta [Myxococcales bacterium]
MNASGISRRYAKALFELAVEDGKFEEMGRELASLRAAFESDPALVTALANPATTREDRMSVAEALIGALKPSPLLANTLRLLADRRRLADLPALERTYRDLADEKSGRVRAKVTTAVPLAEDVATHLSAALQKATAHTVVVERAVDPAILGGAVAQVGSQVFDGSIRNQIEQLKQQLKA